MKNSSLEYKILNLLKEKQENSIGLEGCEITKGIEERYGEKTDKRTVLKALTILKDEWKEVESTEVKRAETGRVRIYWKAAVYFDYDEREKVIESIYLNENLTKEEAEQIAIKFRKKFGKTETDDTVICAGYEKRNPENYSEKIKLIHKARKERKMILFLNRTGGKKSPKEYERDQSGFVKEYLVKPYNIVAAGGTFYLKGSIGDTGIIRYFSLKRMEELEITDINFIFTPIISGGFGRYPINKAEELRPRADGRVRIIAKVNNRVKRYIYDAFPDAAEKIKYANKTEMSFICNMYSAKPFLMQFGKDIEIISPQTLRKTIAGDLREISEKYMIGGLKEKRKTALPVKLFG